MIDALRSHRSWSMDTDLVVFGEGNFRTSRFAIEIITKTFTQHTEDNTDTSQLILNR